MSSRQIFNPFPGLRPFRDTETHLFFGRDDQVDQLLAQLRTTRFVAVMGASGSGKSSLVRAGLLPALHGGFSLRVGSHWRIATFRPGANPIRNLAAALVDDEVLGSGEDDPAVAVAQMEAVLRRSRLGLADVARRRRSQSNGRLLVVVDQFEELFRFQVTADRSRPDDAIAFVQLLIQATLDPEAPLDVIITMRSDFLGDCAQFRDLPETINDGLSLVPRLTRSQLREAIVAPVAVGGGTIAPRLVQRLLNDAGADPDLLPVMQHALMRTWEIWAAEVSADAPLDLDHYEAAGGLGEALSRHADGVFEELRDARSRNIAKVMFKRLTELGADGREVRRPSPVDEVADVAAATPDEVRVIVEHFGAQGRSFVNVSGDEVADISHESLIRQWPKLLGWVREEADSRDAYLRLADDAARWERGEAALLRNPDLQVADDWWRAATPNAAWAARYHDGFDRAVDYLHRSRLAARRRRMVAVGAVLSLAVLAVISTVLGLVALGQKNRAETATAEALAQQRQAVSRQLAATSHTLGAELRVQSILTAVEALRVTAPDGVQLPAAEEALRNALREPLGVSLPLEPDQPRHPDGLSALTFSPDASMLVTARADGSALVWDMQDRAAAPIVLTGGDADVTVAAFSPDGGVLAIADTRGDARLWDVTAFDTAPRVLEGHFDAITALAYRPDGSTLVTASRDSSILLWASDDPGAPPTRLEGDVAGFVNALDVDPSGSRLVSGGGDGFVRLWEFDDPTTPPTLLVGRDARVTAVAFSADGRLVATASEDGTVVLQSTDQGSEPIVLDHRGPVRSVAFSADGRWLALGGDDQTAHLWALGDLQPGGPARAGTGPITIRHADVVEAVAFSPGSRWLATAGRDHVIRLLDLMRPEEAPFVLGGHEHQVTLLAFGSDERWLATGGDDDVAWLWDLDDLATRPAVLEHQVTTDRAADVVAVAFDPVSGRLATATTDRMVRLWDVGDPAATPVFVPHPPAPDSAGAFINELAFAPDGTLLATGGGDRVVRLFDPNDANAAPVELPRLEELITALAFRPDSAQLAVASADPIALVWDTDDLAAGPTQLLGHDDEVTSVAFSADGTLLATGSRDTTIRLRRADDPGDEGLTLRGHSRFVTAVAFDPQARWLASGSDDATVLLWRLDGDQTAVEFTLHHEGAVRAVAFDPSGTRLATADGRTVQLWDLTIANPADRISNPVILRGHDGTVNALAFSADGRLLASGATDDTVRLWLPIEELVDIACDAAGRNLTAEEWSDVRPDAAERAATCAVWPL